MDTSKKIGMKRPDWLKLRWDYLKGYRKNLIWYLQTPKGRTNIFDQFRHWVYIVEGTTLWTGESVKARPDHVKVMYKLTLRIVLRHLLLERRVLDKQHPM